jgi:hypothetical protein
MNGKLLDFSPISGNTSNEINPFIFIGNKFGNLFKKTDENKINYYEKLLPNNREKLYYEGILEIILYDSGFIIYVFVIRTFLILLKT